jgi:outer membrane receptor protein involved in Fe transport
MMRAKYRAACAASLALAASHLTAPVTAAAQASCATAGRAIVPSQQEAAAGPLARRISIEARNISLRTALDRLAAASRVRFSYAADLLPMSRTVCLSYKAAPLGQILADLLTDVAVRPVAVAADGVVLAAEPKIQTSAATLPSLMKQVSELDRVVVTGSSSALADRSVPTSIDVVDGAKIAARSNGSVSSAIDGSVPGVWVWEQSPVSLLARYGSIRGASSFGVSYPKVYVDGIEVANSLLVTHLDPASISRVEIIRGPQGAALYGANAISGVLNIVTRQDGTEDGSARAQIRARGGASASDYSAAPNVLVQNHSASISHGTVTRSARLGATASRIGEFMPDAFSQQITASGGFRRVGSRLILGSTMRFFAQDARAPSNPLALLATPGNADSSDVQSVRQFTFSSSATFTGGSRWTHSAIAGVDGYTLKSALLDNHFPSAIDSALQAATGSAARATIKASTVGQYGDRDKLAATITIGAEHSLVHDRTTMQSRQTSPLSASSPVNLSEIRSNTGVTAHASTSYRDAIFISGGVRAERNTSPTGIGDVATLPMLGVSAVHEFGPATIKLRSAYGKAIRPVQASSFAGSIAGLRGSLLGGSLTPETQAGTEVGADAYIGRFLVLRATRYDQHATGLVQPVRISFNTAPDGLPRRTYVVYELQNVGEITNRGWEFQGSLTEGPWSVGGTFSRVDSRVKKLAARYTGDLRAGDRMLEVPSQTFGFNASYSRGRLFAAWNVARASDWINYDRLALLQRGDPLLGTELRSYWRTYEGVTRMGGRLGIGLARGMTFTLDGENLLDMQRGEPDNVTVLPGRTLSAGLSVLF